jgi:cation diffusion facilitator CzcD-associated flavoprotein CzcO
MTITAEATRMREATGVGARQEPIERWDVVVIGAGLAGMYDLLRHMRDKGPDARRGDARGRTRVDGARA